MTMALRPRNAWEAADLGAAMLRAWWRPVYLALACVMVPIAAAAHLLVDSLLIALLIVWWLKPLYDRVLLHVMARALFGATPALAQTLQALPGLVTRTGLAGALTFKRADPARSFHLPVRQLEGQSGASARSRERLLGRRMSAQTSTLLYGCIAFELVVVASAAGLLELLTPAAAETPKGPADLLQAVFGGMGSEAWGWVVNAFAIGAFFLIEPLYVAAGFALYLHRRTTLEAWDLELRFRRLQDQPRIPSVRAAAMLAAVSIGIAALAPLEPAQAADPSSREIIREVLAGPEFQDYRIEKVWQPRAEDSPSQSGSSALTRWLATFAGSAAELLRLLAYAVLAIGLVLVLHFLARQWLRWRRDSSGSRAARAAKTPEVVFGLDVRPEALPADLAQLAVRAATADPRLALSLLYRGALVSLIHRDRLAIEHGDTEADCVRRVQAAKPQVISAYFARLVETWSQTAYGHGRPSPDELLELCAQWPQHFGMAPP